MLQVVHDVQDYEGPTMSLQDTWRFVVLCGELAASQPPGYFIKSWGGVAAEVL